MPDGLEIEALKTRNTKVEADKAWETSFTRRAIIVIGTYLIIGGYLTYLDVEQAWLHALVPAVSYVLSTLGLGALKAAWIKNIYKK